MLFNHLKNEHETEKHLLQLSSFIHPLPPGRDEEGVLLLLLARVTVALFPPYLIILFIPIACWVFCA
jgi:hypothetical protein